MDIGEHSVDGQIRCTSRLVRVVSVNDGETFMTRRRQHNEQVGKQGHVVVVVKPMAVNGE